MVHGHFVAMGGFAYEDEHSNLHPVTVESMFQIQERERPMDEGINLQEPKYLPTGAVLITYNRPMSESTFKVKNGEVSIDVEISAGDGLRESEFSLRIIDIIADIPESEMTGRSAADGLSKLIAMLQVLWFITQCIERLRLHLSITELEVVTAAFATLNLMVYIFWWYKPLGVDQQIILYSRNLTSKEATSPPLLNSSSKGSKCNLEPEVARETEGAESASMQYMINSMFGTHRLQDAHLKQSNGRVGMLWAGLLHDVQGTPFFIGFFIVPCIFGAIHIAAWDIQFVTVGERWVWRVSAVAITSAPLLIIFLGGCSTYLHLDILIGPLLGLVITSYIMSRFILLILPLLQLRSLPSGAFILISWSTFIPHI
jgi:hypothetical protein